MSITLEFYTDPEKNMHVIYNTRDTLLSRFWNTGEEGERLFKIIHDEFKIQYPSMFKKAAVQSRGWQETFIKILNNHLREKDNRLDIIIKTSGDIIFNLEC